MASRDRVPNELWLEIGHNLAEYDRKTLLAFSLACRTFRRVSRPRLFAEFEVKVYRALNPGSLLLPSSTGVDRRLERLNFWCSPEIAPFVRSCKISKKEEPWYDMSSAEWSFTVEDPYILLDAVFQRLPRFTCLQHLTAHHVHFTQARVDILSRLPPLSKLTVTCCTVADPHLELIEPPLHILQVSAFCLLPEQNQRAGNNFWISVLHPNHLRSLDVIFDARCMGRQAIDIPSFPNVQRLEVSVDFPTPAENIAVLAKFPAVRSLTLRGKGLLTVSISPRSPAVFPLLTKYSGPCQSLAVFLAVDSLTHLAISRCNPQDLISRIPLIQPNLTSIHAEFKHLDVTSFNAMIHLLPQLAELLIRIRVPSIFDMFKDEVYDVEELGKDMVMHGRFGYGLRTGFKPSEFFRAIPSVPHLPHRLERLAIAWECDENQDIDDFCVYKVPDFAELRDTSRAHCPGLKWLYLHGFYFMLEWRDSDGKVSERTAENFVDGYEQCPDIFDDFELML